jgi:hypothetical protein
MDVAVEQQPVALHHTETDVLDSPPVTPTLRRSVRQVKPPSLSSDEESSPTVTPPPRRNPR